ncbi:gluconate 2-dehydrogenase subunit 3 family protein [Algoriphagus sp. H41]|uniref:Gluconate 2-dehydrogenase subunit 3 family protein n=1 Tax=Algoriphagus oliviformis TaxID=2811231 RepID=A0ABS3C6P5_9BACT|nr:gluconate 2-dehydrogenase subunit 3 family protein [Algoriphagus oliviformis]MBN7812787.1 gluconate 2-dehydrogenase subunit 3 family protein [Algoriphagus oliviformis]
MNRRENLKLLFTGSLGTGLMLTACSPEEKAADLSPKIGGTPGGRVPEEIERDNALLADRFFTEQEMALVTILVDIVLPKDAVSGSASEAKVPDYIEFMMKDQPGNQTAFRGGLMWVNLQANERFSKPFTELSESQRMEIIEDIAWPDKAAAGMEPGVKFFNLLRNMTVSGFYTTEMGFKDIGYVGNTPNVWDGVSQEVMDQYGLSLEEKYQSVYLTPEGRGSMATWDDQGNLIS